MGYKEDVILMMSSAHEAIVVVHAAQPQGATAPIMQHSLGHPPTQGWWYWINHYSLILPRLF